MNLKEYTAAAIETESRIDHIAVDALGFINLLETFIAAGNLLDIVKKDTFYGLPTDPKKAADRNQRFIDNALLLKQSVADRSEWEPSEPTKFTNINPRVAHAIIGLATEAVELVEALLSAVVTDQPIDGVNVLEELGDLNWYHAIAVDALGGDWENIQATNIAKLRARNKKASFNAEATINRDVDAERKILESGLTITSPGDVVINNAAMHMAGKINWM